MAKVTFDGINKLITVNIGVTFLDVGIDIYSEWKHWVQLSDNSKYLQALRTFGGDATSNTQNAPSYFFLLNDWQVLVDGNSVDIQLNLYTDNNLPIYIVQNNGAVNARNSDAHAVKSDIDKVLDYQGSVYIDVNNGLSGTKYPIGTRAVPSNNLADSKLIASAYNLFDIMVISNLTIDEELINLNLKGVNQPTINLNSAPTTNVKIFDCYVDGTSNSSMLIMEDCVILEVTNFVGAMDRCLFYKTTPMRLLSGHTIIANCRSIVTGLESPIFDFTNGDIELTVTAYSGGIKYINSTNALNISNTEFISGRYNLDNTSNTEGEFIVGGVVDLNIEYTTQPNVILNLDGVINRGEIFDDGQRTRNTVVAMS